jgi:integrase
LESVASLDSALSAIRTGNKEYVGGSFTEADDWHLKQVCRGLRKDFRKPVVRKRPITQDVLLRLMLAGDLNSFADLTCLTAASVAHNACLRACELLALRRSDITWVMGDDGMPEAANLCIRISKARHDAEAETVSIPHMPLDGLPTSGVRLLWAYINHKESMDKTEGVEDPYLFPSPHHKTALQACSKTVFWRAISRLLRLAGLRPQDFSAHGFRAGGATDLHSGGAPLELGMMLGRWRSRDAYLLYLRESAEQKRNDVRKAFEAAWLLHKERQGSGVTTTSPTFSIRESGVCAPRP